jgi:WD40 repeat protein
MRLWNLETGQEIRHFRWHPGKEVCGAFSFDCRQALSGGEDGTVRLWDVDQGSELSVPGKQPRPVLGVALSKDGQRALSSGDDGVRLWDVATCKELLAIHDMAVCSVAFSPDGSRFLTGGQDCTMRIWDTGSGKEVGRFDGRKTWVWSVAFSPDGRFTLFGTGSHNRDEKDLPCDCLVRVWDTKTATVTRTFTGHQREASALCFSADGRSALSGGPDGSVRWWDVQSGKEMRRFQVDAAETVRSLAFSPDGHTALAGYSSGTIRVFQCREDAGDN